MDILTITFGIICFIESTNGKYMVNKADPTCVGWVGLRPIAVQDCNRILGYPEFTLQDRLDKARCRKMFNILVTHYLGSKDLTMDAIARLWCRGYGDMYKKPEGPLVRGYLKKAQEEYGKFIQLAGSDSTGTARETDAVSATRSRSGGRHRHR